MAINAMKSNTKKEFKDSWQSPPEVFEPLHNKFNFQIDVAADHHNHLCREYYTEEDNALTIDWPEDCWKWCNPPYSEPLPWVRKADKHRKTVMLLNFESSSKWSHVAFRRANFVILPDWRLKFINAETGERGNSQPRCQLIAIFADEPPANGKAQILHMSIEELWKMFDYRNDDLLAALKVKKRGKKNA